MKTYLIKNATLVNEGIIFKGSLFIKNGIIQNIIKEENFIMLSDLEKQADEIINAEKLHLLPGVIDSQVHFRDPGLTHKGDLFTESRAAVAGGITSFMDMPNTNPRALSLELLEEKFSLAASKSLANYSFYMGTSNDNIDEVLKLDTKRVCGIKVFLGASTGNMLVDNITSIEKLFSNTSKIIAVHSEKESIIQSNAESFRNRYGDEIPVFEHPNLRSREACIESTKFITALARKLQARLHVLHLSTKEELVYFDNTIPLENKKITLEVCLHHLWFSDQDYARLGNLIKWNPAIKSIQDRDALRMAVKNNLIDVIATDHAPHTLEEKNNSNYFKAASGGPLVQHLLVALLELYHSGVFSLEEIVQKTSHNHAICFKVKNRGFIREGYAADLVLVDLNKPWTVSKSNLFYKCNWSPFEANQFRSQVIQTFVNGVKVFDEGKICESPKAAQRLEFYD